MKYSSIISIVDFRRLSNVETRVLFSKLLRLVEGVAAMLMLVLQITRESSTFHVSSYIRALIIRQGKVKTRSAVYRQLNIIRTSFTAD